MKKMGVENLAGLSLLKGYVLRDIYIPVLFILYLNWRMHTIFWQNTSPAVKPLWARNVPFSLIRLTGGRLYRKRRRSDHSWDWGSLASNLTNLARNSCEIQSDQSGKAFPVDGASLTNQRRRIMWVEPVWPTRGGDSKPYCPEPVLGAIF